MNCFISSQRTGHVRVLSFKIAIAVLCQGPLEEKYRCEYFCAIQCGQDFELLETSEKATFFCAGKFVKLL